MDYKPDISHDQRALDRPMAGRPGSKQQGKPKTHAQDWREPYARGRPVQGVTVEAIAEEHASSPARPYARPDARTDASGSFELVGVPPRDTSSPSA